MNPPPSSIPPRNRETANNQRNLQPKEEGNVAMTEATNKEEQEWVTTMLKFKNAIRDINQDFDVLYWMRTLLLSGMKYIFYKTQMKHFFSTAIPHKGHFIQFIPLVAILLIVSIIICYDVFLHEYVVQKRWCNGDHISCTGTSFGTNMCMNNDSSFCFWSIFHLAIVHYLGFMILWNYLKTVFTSPGVVLTASEKDLDNLVEWKSAQSRGGLCYINPRLNIEEEERRVSLYKNAVGKELFPSLESNCVFIPSANPSFCKKCQLDRPPRCHHCSKCNRCVLQVSFELSYSIHFLTQSIILKYDS